MIIDHIGIAVKSLDEGLKQWIELFGYSQKTRLVTNTRQKVNVIFMTKENSIDIKLIEPTDKNSPIYQFAQRGGGIHHICFRCENLNNELTRLKELGIRILAEAQPGEAFENEQIAFVYAKNGLNVELIDTEKKADIL